MRWQERARVVPGRVAEADHRGRPLLGRPAGHVHPPAPPGQPVGRRPPDPGVSPSDQERPPGKIIHHKSSSTTSISGGPGTSYWYQGLRLTVNNYSTGISLLIRLRSMPWRLRTMRAPTKIAMARTYIAPM